MCVHCDYTSCKKVVTTNIFQRKNNINENCNKCNIEVAKSCSEHICERLIKRDDDSVPFVGCGVYGLVGPRHCVFTIFHSKSFFKKLKLDIYKCPFLEILKYFWEFDVL